jgi:hypothetical protein
MAGPAQAQLSAIRASWSHIDALAGHVAGFAEMMTRRTGDRDPAGSLDRRRGSRRRTARAALLRRRNPQRPQCCLQRPHLALQLRQGRGIVNKMLKRQMYGRAGFALLRASSFTQRNHRIRGRAVPDVP